jgi:AcrR family transcriptional regulator
MSTSIPYHHGDLRRELLAAAMFLLERDGADAISLRAVARRAGVSHNAPYRHFSSRGALLSALAEAGFAALGSALAAVPRDLAAEPRLERLGQTYLHFAWTHAALYRLMFGSALDRQAQPGLAAAAGEALAELRSAIAAFGPQPDERETVIAAWSMTHGLAHLALDRMLAGDLERDRLAAVATRIFAAGLVRRA